MAGFPAKAAGYVPAGWNRNLHPLGAGTFLAVSSHFLAQTENLLAQCLILAFQARNALGSKRAGGSQRELRHGHGGKWLFMEFRNA